MDRPCNLLGWRFVTESYFLFYVIHENLEKFL